MSGHRNPPRKKNKSPSHSKPKADEENRGAPEQEARASHDEPSPPTINIIEAAKEKSMAWWRKWSFYKGSMEVLSLFGVSFYCWVTYQQWADLRHNFETDQRAWLAPNWSFNSDKTFSPADVIVPGKMFDGDAAIRLTNMGKSPILRTDTHVWIEILDHGAPQPSTGNIRRVELSQVLFSPEDTLKAIVIACTPMVAFSTLQMPNSKL